MKKTRFLSLLLALCMIASSLALVSCDKEETDETESASSSETGSEKETEVFPDVEKKNYDKEFYLHIIPDVNPVDFYWVKESKNDILSDAIYTRQEKVRQAAVAGAIAAGTVAAAAALVGVVKLFRGRKK